MPAITWGSVGFEIEESMDGGSMGTTVEVYPPRRGTEALHINVVAIQEEGLEILTLR